MTGLTVVPLAGLPVVTGETPLATEIVAALRLEGAELADGDVLVIAQKVVSKAERRLRSLPDVTVGEEAARIAQATEREPALVQLILDESEEVLRAMPAAIVVRHRTGHVLANAGIDASNVGEAGKVLIWPDDPDASARALREEITRLTGRRPAIVIADSMGRAWRVGTIGTAIGCAGLPPLEDRRGETDLFGRELEATIVGIADAVAAVGVLVMGEGSEGTPVALVRGAERWVTPEHGPGAAAGLRPVEQDMFR